MTGKKPKGGAGSMPSTYASSGSASRAGRNRPAVGPAQEKLAAIRQSLELGSSLKDAERLRAITRLPPHEHIVALVRGLDRDPSASAPWTGDSRRAWEDDPERCVRRFVAALEDRMRATVAAAVEEENRKSLSPAWRERDLLNAVFQRVDKERHGKLTGDCDLSMFMRAWGNAPAPAPDPRGGSTRIHVADDDDDDAVIEHVEDSGTGAAPEVSVSPRRKIGKKPVGVGADSKVGKKVVGSDSRLGKISESAAGLSLSQRLERGRESASVLASIALRNDVSGAPVVTQAAAAAIFVKYGYDRDGYMPYEVFINALLSAPSRLLGMEPIFDAAEAGKHGFDAGDDFAHDGKIIYPKCRSTVFPPSEFDPRNVTRSSKAPSAELELEHCYGYAGLENTAPNLFYLTTGEVVYYTAALGVVLDKDKLEKKKRCQRFFHGHDDDIKCLAIHPNREWVATGQLGRRPYVCVWDAITCQQLQRIVHPAGMRGVVAVAFSQSDGGDHLVAVNTDNAHTVMVWRWSKGGDAAAIERAKTVAGWRFGPEKRLDRLEFYEESAEGAGGGSGGKKKSATSAPSQAMLAAAAANDGAGDADGAVAAAEAAAAGSAAAEAWRHGDGTYELVGEGQGINGLPPMVYGAVWNPFPGMEEFVTYGAKHIKVWRKVKVGAELRWVGEMGLRNDGLRVADCSQRNPGDPNTGEGKISAAAALAAASKTSSRPGSAAGAGAAGVSSPKPNPALSKSMTPLSKLGPASANGSRPPSRPSSAARRSLAAAAAAKPPGVGESGSKGSQVTVGGENIVSAVYVRRDVIVTGFPSGALGVWTVSHHGADGARCHPVHDAVARWTVSMAQRIVGAHEPGPRVNLNDGTTTYGGVRAMTMRADGATMLTGGADGWVHTWELADGTIAVVGRPKTDGPGKPPVERRRAVLLRKLGSSGETAGPNSFKISSPYQNEPPPAFRAIDCRPQDSSQRRAREVPYEFVMGTNKCDVWEVEYKRGIDRPPTIGVQVYGHTADLYAVASHPTDPDVFASCAEADRVFLWNANERTLARTAPVGLVGRSICFSATPVPKSQTYFPDWRPVNRKDGTACDAGHHLAVGGKFGKIAILDGVTLQPLVKLKDVGSAVDDLKYCGGPRAMLAAASHDICVDVYDVHRGYTHLSRCRGHMAAVTHLDWSLPMFPHLPAERILQATCAACELLYWEPVSGEQVLENQRDARWESWTCAQGFPVMGIWEDGSDRTDVNAVDRAKSGQATFDEKTKEIVQADRCAGGLDRAGYVVTADDFGKVKLFNYPCVFNDAPYREYKGHASHAMCVRFSCDDKRVFTAGGHDRAVLQFVTRGVRCDETLPAYTPPPEPKRTWGPIDGGKAYGWIEEKGTSGGAGGSERRNRRAPPKAIAGAAAAEEALRLKREAEEAARAKEEKRLADLALGPKPSNANYGQTSAGATGTVAGLSAGIAKRDVADVDKPLTAMAAQQQPKQQPKQQQPKPRYPEQAR